MLNTTYLINDLAITIFKIVALMCLLPSSLFLLFRKVQIQNEHPPEVTDHCGKYILQLCSGERDVASLLSLCLRMG